jgi:hypothetical protein
VAETRFAPASSLTKAILFSAGRRDSRAARPQPHDSRDSCGPGCHWDQPQKTQQLCKTKHKISSIHSFVTSSSARSSVPKKLSPARPERCFGSTASGDSAISTLVLTFAWPAQETYLIGSVLCYESYEVTLHRYVSLESTSEVHTTSLSRFLHESQKANLSKGGDAKLRAYGNSAMAAELPT